MPRVIEPSRPRGFTLLEMLVALSVLGFLMVGLSTGVRTGLDFWNMQNRRIGTTAELDSSARVLRALLTGIPILPTGAANAGNNAIAISFAGKADQLTFVGDLPTGLGGTQRADITLALSGGRLVLLWSPRRHEIAGAKPAPTKTELMRGVDRLQLAYWGASGATAGWLAEWHGPGLPKLIRIRLSFAKGDSRHWPDFIAAPQLSASDV